MSERDAHGRFMPGNRTSVAGGKARMAGLSKWQRRELASYGFRMLAYRRFGGRRRACAAWLFDPLGYRQQEGTPCNRDRDS
jgi:hypothetical protein